MKRYLGCLIGLVMVILLSAGCSVKDTVFREPPRLEVQNSADSGDNTHQYVPVGTCSWTYHAEGKKQTAESDNRDIYVLPDPYDRATNTHLYFLWFGSFQIPDSVTIWILNEKMEKTESVEFLWNKETGVCQLVPVENGQKICVEAQWTKKHYTERGYYGSAVYYFQTYYPKYE